MIISNDPSWWLEIDWDNTFSYFMGAGSTIAMYDWALTFGKEVDLIWKQQWSLMTFLYFVVRYMGIPYCVASLLGTNLSVALTDKGCVMAYQVSLWVEFIVNAALWVIMVVRLHAMYHEFRKILIFLVVTPLAFTVACGVMVVIRSRGISGEQYVLSGTHNCTLTGHPSLSLDTWILRVVWEVIALCLTIWVAVGHFREMRRRPTGSAAGDCLSVLIKNNILYFIGFAAVALIAIGTLLSPVLMSSLVANSILIPSKFILMFVLGPRLILSIRDYHAKLSNKSEFGIGMSTITFKGLTYMESTNDSSASSC